MDLDGSIFYWLGGALVLAALVLSYVGIRGKAGWPSSTRSMTAILAVFGLLVVVTSAYAVANAREEQEHREEELAHEQAEGEHAVSEGEQEPGAQEGQQEGEAPPIGEQTPSAGQRTELDLTSPEDGSLSFEPDSLQAPPSDLLIAYENPSPVPHNVAVEDVEEQLLGESETITNSTTELEVEVTPGEHIYFCTIPGHREGGMEGVLTVEE